MEKENRSIFLDIAKGVAIINIIFIHTLWKSGETYVPYDFLRQASLMIDVPLFFFLSGWAATFSPNNAYTYFKRLMSLYIPYLFFLIFLVFILSIYNHRTIALNDLLNWLLLNFKGYSYKYEWEVAAQSIWFLQVYFPVLLVTPFLMFISNNKKLSVILLIILILIIIIFSVTSSTIKDISIIGGKSTLTYLFFYIFFYFLGMYSRNMVLKLKELLIIFLIILIMLVLSYMNGFRFNLQLNKFPPTFYYLLMSLFSVSTCLYLKKYEQIIRESLHKSFLIRFLQLSGKKVYYIYLYQGFGASIIFPLATILKTDYNWFVVFIICAATNLAISYILALIFYELSFYAIQANDRLLRKLT